MGSFQTKDKSYPKDKVVEGLKHNVRFLQAEVNEIMCMREYESQVNAQEMIIFALKEAEWKKERKKLKEEVKKLKKKLEQKEEKFKGVENDEMFSVKGDKWRHQLATSYLLEQIRNEEAIRDEAIEKWKQLYFAIKMELDDLIHRTNQGGGLCWKTEQMELLEKLHMELKEKEEKIALLKEEIASKEQQELKREREIDIMRQSLKIMSYNMKVASFSKNLSKSLHL